MNFIACRLPFLLILCSLIFGSPLKHVGSGIIDSAPPKRRLSIRDNQTDSNKNNGTTGKAKNLLPTELVYAVGEHLPWPTLINSFFTASKALYDGFRPSEQQMDSVMREGRLFTMPGKVLNLSLTSPKYRHLVDKHKILNLGPFMIILQMYQLHLMKNVEISDADVIYSVVEHVLIDSFQWEIWDQTLDENYEESNELYKVLPRYFSHLRSNDSASDQRLFDSFKLLMSISVAPPSPKLLFLACATCNAQLVEYLLAMPGIDPRSLNSKPLRLSIENDCNNILKMLLQDGRADPNTSDNYVLFIATVSGNIGAVELLLEDGRVDPKADETANGVFRMAASEGSCDILALYLKYGHFLNEAILDSARGGYLECVELLLRHPLADPTVNGNEPLIASYNRSHFAVARYLALDSRVRERSEFPDKAGKSIIESLLLKQ